MKKQLLLMMAAFMGTASSAFALGEGDYVYTSNGRFVITGTNLLVENGDFSDGLNGWKTVAGADQTDENFTVTATGGGPNGDLPYIMVKKGTPVGGAMGGTLDGLANLRRAVQVKAGQTYVATYWIRSASGGVNSNARYSGRNDNYQDVYLKPNDTPCYSVDAAGTKTDVYDDITSIAEWFTPKAGEWMQVAYNFTVGETDQYLTFEFFNLIGSDCFADFGVYPASMAGNDDRVTKDLISFLEAVKADPQIVTAETNVDDLDGGIEYLQDLLEDPNADQEEVMGIVEGEQDFFSFLDENFANAAVGDNYDYVAHFDFNDCAEKGANKGAADGWTEAGGRWGVAGTERNNFFNNHLIREIPANYGFGAGSQYQTVSLPAGKYLYVVKAYGYKYYGNGSGSSSNYYIPDFSNQMDSLAFFINGDTCWINDAPTTYGKVYYHVFDVKEDGEQTIGFYNRANSAFGGNDRSKTSGGGRIGFDNLFLYSLDNTAEALETFYLKNNLSISAAALQESIDAVAAALEGDVNLYGRQTLTDSLTWAKETLAAATKPTQENIDLVDEVKEKLDADLRAFNRQNAEYVALGTAIDEADALYADEERTEGKADLQAAINTAKGVYDGMVAAEIRPAADSTALVDATAALSDAVQVFYYANATWQNPASVLIQNADFADNAEHWTNDGGSADGKANWKFGTSETPYGSYRFIYYNRGNSAADDKWLYQDVKIMEPGVYEFFAVCAVHNSKWDSVDGNDSYTYLYTSMDSVNVITKGPGEPKNQVLGDFGQFSVRSTVNDLKDPKLPAEGYLRIGLEKRKDNGANTNINMIYFGNPILYYYGTEEDFKTGIYDVERVETTPETFNVYSLNGVKVRSNATSLDGLAKGIYIVNGKKYVVK